MQLKEIDMDDITINPEQPREHFDTDKIKELGESIKEVGLINPINVEKKGKRYEIISGERRYRGNKVVKNKKILALVKEYKNKGHKAVESLIENLHREDLSNEERAKFCRKIQETENIKTLIELGKRIGTTHRRIGEWYDTANIRAELPVAGKVSDKVITETRSLPMKERKKIIQKAVKDDIGGLKVRKLVSAVKMATPQVKEAMLKDDISVNEAEKVLEIKDEHRQKKAIDSIKQHKEEAKKYTKHLKEKTEPIKKIEKTKEEIISEALKDLMQQLHTKTFDVGLQCDKMVDLLETLYQATVTHNNITVRIIQNLKPQAKKDIKDCLNVMAKRMTNLLKTKEKILRGI